MNLQSKHKSSITYNARISESFNSVTSHGNLNFIDMEKELVSLWFGDPGKWESRQVLGNEELAEFAQFVIDQQEQSKWVSVDERLPAPLPGDHYSNSVLTTDGTYQEVTMYDGRHNVWAHLNRCVDVTHWQPLPKLPKQ